MQDKTGRGVKGLWEAADVRMRILNKPIGTWHVKQLALYYVPRQEYLNERFNKGLTQALALLESAAVKPPHDVVLVNVQELTADALHKVYWDRIVPSAIHWQREIRRVFAINEHSGSDVSKLGVRVPLLLIQFKEFDSALMAPYIDGHVSPRQIVTIVDVLHSLSDTEQRRLFGSSQG